MSIKLEHSLRLELGFASHKDNESSSGQEEASHKTSPRVVQSTAMLPLFSAAAVAGVLSSTAVYAQEPIQVPTQPTHVKTIVSPGGLQIRYKQPTFCETTPGVNSYSGYIDIDKDHHYFFLFYESRNRPEDDPITVWLTGGPGSDSLLAAYLGQ